MLNCMVSLELGANERMPWMDSLSIFDMAGGWGWWPLHPAADSTQMPVMKCLMINYGTVVEQDDEAVEWGFRAIHSDYVGTLPLKIPGTLRRGRCTAGRRVAD